MVVMQLPVNDMIGIVRWIAGSMLVLGEYVVHWMVGGCVGDDVFGGGMGGDVGGWGVPLVGC
jgi:hypothetical protein